LKPAFPRPGHICAWLILAAVCHASFAWGGGPKITPYTHVDWGPNEGVPPHIEAITQTADDFLWIGSEDGLFRFDGVTFERYQPQSGAALPRDAVTALLALPNGDLWIGYYSGAISLLRNGHAVNYGTHDGVPRVTILSLAQDQSGTIWASCRGGLLRLQNNEWQHIGRGWNYPGAQARALFVDRAGTLWVSRMGKPTGQGWA
jgi:ligand-binding sensor domain-containing protein